MNNGPLSLNYRQVSHPKVVSMPLGVTAPGMVFNLGQRILNLVKGHQTDPGDSEGLDHGTPRYSVFQFWLLVPVGKHFC